MKIRQATIKDKNFVKQLDKENMNLFFKKIGTRYYGNLFKPFITKNCFILENPKPVGFAYIEIKGKNMNLVSIQINRFSQGKGYGKRLIRFLTSYAKKKKLSKLKSIAHEENKLSIKFHKKAGFKIGKTNQKKHVPFEINLK